MPRTSDQPDIRERLLAGAADVLVTDGIDGLTVRRVAEAAGRSTMCVYTKFGSRRGLIQGVFTQAETDLAAVLRKAKPIRGNNPLGVASAYRRFARQHPAAYALLFEHPIGALDLDESARRDAIARVVALLAEAGANEPVAALATMHGLITIERTQPPPAGGWETFYLRIVEKTMATG
jgi:AcrR family transcriptional regulator